MNQAEGNKKKQSWWWVPHEISLLRWPAGVLVFWFAVHEQWWPAIWVMFPALFTDALDGWAAKKLGVESRIGKDWIDPLSDFALSMGTLGGYVFHDHMWPHRIWWALTIIVSTVILKALKQQKRFHSLHLFAYGFTPFYYLFMCFVFGYIYANRALNSEQMKIVLSLMPVIVIGFCWFKWHRLQDWGRSLTMAFRDWTQSN